MNPEELLDQILRGPPKKDWRVELSAAMLRIAKEAGELADKLEAMRKKDR